MDQIDGKQLRALRKRKGWTLEQAIEKTKVSRAQLQRLEKSGSKRARAETLKRLCQGYEVAPGDLAPAQGGNPIKSGRATSRWDLPIADLETQVSARISSQAKNAFSLVAHRYGITQTALIEAAPLLFIIMAHDSMADRRKNLAELRASLTQQNETALSVFRHCPGLFPDSYDLFSQGQFLDAEENSINANDWLGLRLNKGHQADDNVSRVHTDEYDHARDNPFASLLQRRAQDFAQGVSFHENGSTYDLADMFRDVVTDPFAAVLCAQGWVPFHAMPKELLVSGKEDERLEWLRDRASASDRSLWDSIPAMKSASQGDKS